MSKIIRFIIEIENVDDMDFSIETGESSELLSIMENEAARRGYSIYDTRVEEDEA